MDWELKRELKEQLAQETGYYRYPMGTRTPVALVYPNSYFVGMSNLGLHIVYELLNERDDVSACSCQSARSSSAMRIRARRS